MLWFLLGLALASSASVTCGIQDFDLSPLIRTDKDYTYEIGDAIWYINPCANTIRPCEGDLSPGPVVQNYDHGQPYACFSFAQPVSQSPGIWNLTDDGVSVLYKDGDTCYSETPPSAYSMRINFHCDPETKGTITKISMSTACYYIAEFSTMHACKGKVPAWYKPKEILRGIFVDVLGIQGWVFDEHVSDATTYLPLEVAKSAFYGMLQIPDQDIGQFEPKAISQLLGLQQKLAKPFYDLAKEFAESRLTTKFGDFLIMDESDFDQVRRDLKNKEALFVSDTIQAKRAFKAADEGRLQDMHFLGVKLGDMLNHTLAVVQ